MAFGKLGARGGFGSLGVLGTVRPSWVQPGAIFDEDFFNQRAWPRPFSSEMVDGRTSGQYSPNYTADGSASLFFAAQGVLPISNAYLEVEASSINTLNSPNSFTGVNYTIDGGVTFTPSFGVAPDGSSPATRMQTTGANIGFRQASGSINTAYNSTLYVKSNTAIAQSAAFWNGSADALVTVPASGWARVQATPVQFTSGTRWDFYGKQALDISIAFAKFELGTTPTSYLAGTRAANSIVIQRTGVGRIVFTFDDNTQQTISGINTGAQYTLPTNLNRPLIKRMTGYAS